jgi:cell division protease FtsH
MVAYYGMSDKLKNLSYYDSSGKYDMGFAKPYSDKTAEVIDAETAAIIAEQMERAKKILQENAEGHNKLAELLLDREVITSEDVESILGPRPWKSREDEIIAANEEQKGENKEQVKEPTIDETPTQAEQTTQEK